MVTLEQLRSAYRPEILRRAEENGVEQIRVFGSVARGDQREDSDVDFLVRIKPGCGLWEMGELLWQLEALLKTEVQVVDEWSVQHHAFPDEREHIFREAVAL